MGSGSAPNHPAFAMGASTDNNEDSMGILFAPVRMEWIVSALNE
jgi:hypothetical protein